MEIKKNNQRKQQRQPRRIKDKQRTKQENPKKIKGTPRKTKNMQGNLGKPIREGWLGKSYCTQGGGGFLGTIRPLEAL